jgi:DNA-binding NarL/FixJ family response regulator
MNGVTLADAWASRAADYLASRRAARVVKLNVVSLNDAWASRAADYLASRRAARVVKPRAVTAEPYRRPPCEPGERRQELSPRLCGICLLVSEGKTNRDIAEALDLSEGTVRVYVSKTLQILGFHSRNQIIMWYLKGGKL